MRDRESPEKAEALLEALKDVIDPELGYNVVDLGLIYSVTVDRGQAEIVMTMTTPGCPAADYIEAGVRARAEAEIGQVSVAVVWSPPWSPDMMSDEAKLFFGRM